MDLFVLLLGLGGQCTYMDSCSEFFYTMASYESKNRPVYEYYSTVTAITFCNDGKFRECIKLSRSDRFDCSIF